MPIPTPNFHQEKRKEKAEKKKKKKTTLDFRSIYPNYF